MTGNFLNFLNEAKARGYFFQSTDEEAIKLLFEKGETITCYVGFDCTARSLHVGNLVPIMFARLIQKYGHKIIVLLGGATTKIGDPSGKDETRKLLSTEEIDSNISSIKKIITKFISVGEAAIFVNNNDWLEPIKYLDLLRDVGPHFSINRMLEFESVKSRLQREAHLSFLEFNYMILQAYDFVELHKKFGCNLQIGGSDQWGNIINGIELGRKLGCAPLFGITTPLVITASGKKMGKTAAGAIWLEKDLLSAYDYWQYFRNTDDADIIKFLKLFTDLPLEEINQLAKESESSINQVKKILATEATKICHGKEEALKAQHAAMQEFELKDSSALPVIKLEMAAGALDGINIIEALKQIGFASSNAEAKRLIREGSIKVNEAVITDPDFIIENNSKISLGKKKRVLISY